MERHSLKLFAVKNFRVFCGTLKWNSNDLFKHYTLRRFDHLWTATNELDVQNQAIEEWQKMLERGKITILQSASEARGT